MVFAGVIILSILWIGSCNAMPNDLDRTSRNVLIAAGPFKRFDTPSEAIDPTSRMDLIKSLDDILGASYDGPHLHDLEPFMIRNSFRRPARDSANFRKRPSLFQSGLVSEDKRRFPQESNVHVSEEKRRFPQESLNSGFTTSFSKNSFGTPSSFDRPDSFGNPSFSESKPERKRRPNTEEDRFPSSFSSDIDFNRSPHFGQNNEHRFSFDEDSSQRHHERESFDRNRAQHRERRRPFSGHNSDFENTFRHFSHDFNQRHRREATSFAGKRNINKGIFHYSEDYLRITSASVPHTSSKLFKSRTASYKPPSQYFKSEINDKISLPYRKTAKLNQSNEKRIFQSKQTEERVLPLAYFSGPSPPANILRPYNIVRPPFRTSFRPSRRTRQPTQFKRNDRLRLPVVIYRKKRYITDPDSQFINDGSQGFFNGKPKHFPNFEDIGGVVSLSEGAAAIEGKHKNYFEIPPSFSDRIFGKNKIQERAEGRRLSIRSHPQNDDYSVEIITGVNFVDNPPRPYQIEGPIVPSQKTPSIIYDSTSFYPIDKPVQYVNPKQSKHLSDYLHSPPVITHPRFNLGSADSSFVVDGYYNVKPELSQHSKSGHVLNLKRIDTLNLPEYQVRADHFSQKRKNAEVYKSLDDMVKKIDGIQHDNVFTKDTNGKHIRTLSKRSVTQNVKITLPEDLFAEESAHSPSYHRTVARKEANPEFYIPHIRVPRQYSHRPRQDYGRNQRAESISHFSREGAIYGPRRKFVRDNGDRIIPDSQRFYPSFPQGRLIAPRPPIFERNHRAKESSNSFSRHPPSFRNHGPHEAFATQRLNDFGPVDNSILGSGNFEVIKGGTFFDNDDPHLNHNPYDPYLDNSYVVFPFGGNDHNYNQVQNDDFFSNFRDFSEFATKRADTHHQDERGYASEHIPLISSVGDMMTSDSNQTSVLRDTFHIIMASRSKEHPKSTENNKYLVSENTRKLKPKQIKKYKFIKKSNNLNDKSKSSDKHRPKNIQDVLNQLDQFPVMQMSSNDNIEDLDPLIATF